MPVLTIHSDTGDIHLTFNPGDIARDVLIKGGFLLRSGCAGTGACGMCRVHVKDIKPPEPTDVERFRLSEEQLFWGVRLACQFPLQDDLVLEFPDSSDGLTWHSWYSTNLMDRNEVNTATELAVAVDLGTTQIKASLWDKTHHKQVMAIKGINPQIVYGSDVMSRLVAAKSDIQTAQRLLSLIKDALGDAFKFMAQETGLPLKKINQVMVVGNTAMLALFSGKNGDLLLQPDYWTRWIDCALDTPKEYALAWGIDPHAEIENISPLAGFVGSDLLAGLISQQIIETPAKSLFIDFGTNSEIALWDGHALWITSAAGGPAFEGAGIQFGMSAEPGAIYQATWNEELGNFVCQVLGPESARGICGSGMIDIIAVLQKQKIISPVGRFLRYNTSSGFLIDADGLGVSIRDRDIDMFQRAKAAIGAGIELLVRQAGVVLDELQHVYISGSFGQYLNIQHAQEIGLLPCVDPAIVELSGDTALAGCAQMLFNDYDGALKEILKREIHFINLGQKIEYEDLFINNLRLQPLRLH